MKAKEKADDLVSEFIFNCKHTEYVDDNEYKDSEIIRLINSKQCALICVDEMVSYLYDIEFHKREDAIKSVKYWKEVKQEINKL
jgi:hypothetical protein